MNFRITLGLAVLLLALAGAYAFLPKEDDPSTTGAAGLVQGPSLIGYKEDEVSGITVKSAADSVTLRRADGGDWSYGLHGAAPAEPADQTRIRGLASRLAGLRAQSTVATEPNADQVTEYGLQSP